MTTMNGDGTLGSWSSIQGLPSAHSFHSSAVNDGHLYILGGYTTGGINTNDVLIAPFNVDGTLGAFNSSANRFATPRYGHRSFTHNGRLYVLGGHDGTMDRGNIQMTTFVPCAP